MRNALARAAACGVLLVALCPSFARAADPEPPPNRERWSITVGGGYFAPAIEGWKEQYGRRGGWLPTLAGSYALTPRLSIGGEAGYWTADSLARDVTGALSSERQRLTLVPVTAGVEYALRGSADQTLVPFLGVGYRRVIYHLAVEGKDAIRGGAGGWVGRGGFDLLLNALDPTATAGLAEEWGITRTSLRIEAQRASVTAAGPVGDVDLGGTTVLLGLRFEF
ncbi:MAG: hypothetical protein A2638_00625 [Nitrospirae bacterium RIFCSPHIGHO2_01_FULL_66_17]|nr:MAG: hypothetical protein A2638_00625 [Nitrospirae bacterium RIFCSPHIGHO2_01_FULL_66_17]